VQPFDFLQTLLSGSFYNLEGKNMKRRQSALLVVFCLLPYLAYAQSTESDDKEKAQKRAAIIEQALADIGNLKLPENRALFYSEAGTAIWPDDQKRARSLFQSAADELIAAQQLAESRRSNNPYNELLSGGNTRQRILNNVASHDAELALQLLVKTRPAAIQRAMSGTAEKSGKIGSYYQNDLNLAQNENYMEQNFYRQAAEQNPERAVKILKDSLSKGLSNETLNQLNRLAEKDSAAAAEMGSQVISKLLQASYISDNQANYVNIQLTQGILNQNMSTQEGQENRVKFDGGQLTDLAAKLINAYLSDRRVAGNIGGIDSIAQKYSPGSVEAIKKAIKEMTQVNQPSQTDLAYQKLMNSDTPSEQMLAVANKFPPSNRREIFQTASNKLMNQGNWQAARAVLDENFSDEAREQLLNNFDSQLCYNFINQGKFSDAERVIDGMAENQRVSALVNLANSAYGRDQKENKAYALGVLDKAGQLINDKPENNREMELLMQLISGYSNIEPGVAIRKFEGLVPKINELTDAAAIVYGFQLNSNVRDGEFILTQGDPFGNYGVNSSMIGSFARYDLDRTTSLIDSFSRPEMKTLLRLQLIPNIQNNVSSLPIQGRRLRNIVSFSGNLNEKIDR